MKPFELILHFPSGVLVGGYSTVPDGLHAMHASDQQNRPLIPATALRGALRESLEALLRGAGEKACSGGDGLDPETTTETSAPVPCTLDNGTRCIACRLFGTRRPTLEPGEISSSGLVLGDAVLEKGDHAPWMVRPNVGIARKQRSVEHQRLFFQRMPWLGGKHFVARGRCLSPDLEKYLKAAVRATKHIGAGRSRGLARVDIELHERDESETALGSLPDGDVRVRVTLESPACIGVPVVFDNLRDTRLEIPGSALRGAIGFALAEVLDNPNEDQPFQTLVSDEPSTGAHFGFLYPVDEKANGLSSPLPITAAACKREKRKHGVVDQLLDRLAMAHIEKAEQVSAAERGALSVCAAAGCGQPLRGLSGWRERTEPVATRTVTRAALDRKNASVRHQALFSQVMMEAGTSFEGTIRNVPEASRAVLAQGLSRPISVGRGRSSGWGRVKVELRAPVPLPTLEERGKRFDEALKARLAQAGLSTGRVGRLIPVTLLSPLLPKGDDDGEALLQESLEGALCFLKARRFSREGGLDQRQAGMQPVLATAAGSVFVIELGDGRTWRDALGVLERIERHGVGARRVQGYGQVLCFDPFFLQRSFTR